MTSTVNYTSATTRTLYSDGFPTSTTTVIRLVEPSSPINASSTVLVVVQPHTQSTTTILSTISTVSLQVSPTTSSTRRSSVRPSTSTSSSRHSSVRSSKSSSSRRPSVHLETSTKMTTLTETSTKMKTLTKTTSPPRSTKSTRSKKSTKSPTNTSTSQDLTVILDVVSVKTTTARPSNVTVEVVSTETTTARASTFLVEVTTDQVLNAHGFNLHNNHHGLPISITYRLANLVVFKTHDTWHLLHDAWSDEESHPSDLIENENRGSYYTFLYFGGFHSYDLLQNEDRGSCHNHHAFPIIFHRYLGAERLVQNQDQAEVVYWSQKDQEMFIHSQSFVCWEEASLSRDSIFSPPRLRWRPRFFVTPGPRLVSTPGPGPRPQLPPRLLNIGGVQTKTVTLDIDRPSRPTKTVTVDIGRPGRSTRTLSRTGLTVVVSETPAATITIPGHSTTITRRPSTASTTVDSSTPGSQTITVSDARVRQIRGMNAGINDRKLGTFKGLGKDRKTVKFPNKHGSDACKAMSKKCKFAAKDNNTVLPCQERLAYEVFQLYEADPNQSFARGEVVACIDQNTNYCASIDWQPWIQKSPKAGKFVEDLMTQRSLNDQDEVPIASVVESMNWMLDSDARLCGETLLTVEKQRHSAGNNLGDMVGRYVLKLGTAPPKKHGPTFEDGSNDHSTDDKDGDDDDESYTPWVKPSGRHFVFPNIHDNSVVSDV
ncbi:hypothetical protein D6D05_03571 [Aureobasidium pullulans]|nr:hypothetical protein D6D05_03571 [Aureobasidium pullulans]